MKASKKLRDSLQNLRDQGIPFAKIDELSPWDDNPRLNAPAVPGVMRSMQRFGWTNPVLVRAADGFVEAGHTRLLAAANLGLDEVPVIRLEHGAQDARLYALADNRIAEIATWSPDLAAILGSFEAAELVDAGFDDVRATIAALSEQKLDIPGTGPDSADALAEGVPPPSAGAAAETSPAPPAASVAADAAGERVTDPVPQQQGEEAPGETAPGDPAPPPASDPPRGGGAGEADDVAERPEDRVLEMPAEVSVALGDLYQLGEHRLLVGDCTKLGDVRRLMVGPTGPLERAVCIVTDPPYAIYGSSSGIESDVADDKMVRPFFRDILTAVVASCEAFAHFYICCDWRSWSSWWEVARGTPCRPKNMIVWDKAGGLGANYANCHELLMFGSLVPMRTTMRTDKGVVGMRTTKGSNIWRINRALRVEGGEKRAHNAQKPAELYERAFENSSEPGDVVLDLFAGSGTCLIAAQKMGRRCRTMEIEPRWAEYSIARWEAYTGQKAVKLA